MFTTELLYSVLVTITNRIDKHKRPQKTSVIQQQFHHYVKI